MILEYWRVRREPCHLCGGPIDYDRPRYRYSWAGGVKVRKENPAALDVDHILGQDLDKRRRWCAADTRPTHARCNRRRGAAYVNAKYGGSTNPFGAPPQARRPPPRVQPCGPVVTSRRW